MIDVQQREFVDVTALSRIINIPRIVLYAYTETYIFVLIPVILESNGQNSVNINERTFCNTNFDVPVDQCFVHVEFQFVTQWNRSKFSQILCNL